VIAYNNFSFLNNKDFFWIVRNCLLNCFEVLFSRDGFSASIGQRFHLRSSDEPKKALTKLDSDLKQFEMVSISSKITVVCQNIFRF
jgi:hypothetical protein